MASSGARVVAAFLAGRTAFGLSFLAGAVNDLPTVWYLPLERAFVFGSRPAAFAMEWYGRTFVSLLVGGAVTAAVWIVGARGAIAIALQKRSFVIAVAQAAALALAVDFAYFGWVMLSQTPKPLPLPPGCVP